MAGHRRQRRVERAGFGAVVLLGVLAAPAAHAGMIDAAAAPADRVVLINDAEMVVGNSAKSMELDLPDAGTLTLNVTDLTFTGALEAFEFGLSETSSSVSGMIDADSMTIDFTRPTKLYLDLFAHAGRRTGFGLYSIFACFQPSPKPVPLPASWLTLVCGLAGMFWVIRLPRA